MQTKQLRYIVEIARQQSLSGAARVLGVSQPALSQFLAAEEKELGISLFLPYQNKLFPTPAGMVYLNAAEKMLRIKEQTYQKIQSCRTASAKTITVGISSPVTAKLIAKAVPTVCGNFPYVSVIPVTGKDVWLKEQLQKGKLNMAILGYHPAEAPGNGFFQFARRELTVLIPRNFDLSYPLVESSVDREILPPAELKNFPVILSTPQTLLRQLTDEVFSEMGSQANEIHTASDLFVMLELAHAGFGIAFLWENLIPLADQKKCRLFSLPQHPQAVFGIDTGGRELDEEEKLLIRCILNTARKEEGDTFLYNAASRRFMEDHGEERLWTRNS